MNIAGISPQGFQRVNTLLGEVGRAIDPKSHAKTTVSDIEAKRIVQAFDKLEPNEKAEVAKALQALMQQDVFTVSDKARTTFASALGVDTKILEPQAKVSAAPVRTVMQQALQALTRPVQIDAKTFNDLKAGLKDAPKPIGDFLISALKSASEDGVIKMEPEARKEFTKEFAARDGNSGAVQYMTNKFGEDFVKKMPPMAFSMLSSPPFFEEILAALMITLVNTTNEEVLREQANIDQVVKGDQKKTAVKSDDQKARIKADLEGNGKTDKPTEGKPVEGTPEGGRLASTKGKLEAVVSSIDARMKDGSISLEDSKAIVAKLERFHPKDPVTKLVAEAMGTAMEHSGLAGDRVVGPRLAPIMEWAKKVTGKDTFPKPTGLSSDKPLARALMESDKIEQRLAGFLVDAFIDRAPRRASRSADSAAADTPVQTAMEKFKPVLQQVLAEAAPAEAAKPAVGTPDAMLDKFQGLVDNREKLPAGAIEKTISNTVENVAKDMPAAQKQVLKAAYQSAFDSLPKTGKCSKDDVKSAFAKATGHVIDSVVDGKAPDDVEMKVELLDKKLGEATQKAADRIDEAKDRGTEMTPEQQQAVLAEELGKASSGLLTEAKQAGFDDKQLDALAQTFARQGAGAAKQLASEGKLAPTAPGGMGHTDDPTASDDTRSRQLMFEKLKFKMNMLSEMMQAMSNVLNTLHQNAENAIRAIR